MVMDNISIRKKLCTIFPKAPIFAFVELYFCAINSTFRNHSQTSFRTKLHYLRYFVLRDYLPKTRFCNPMHDATLQIKMCAISHKTRAVFCQLLILNLIKIKTYIRDFFLNVYVQAYKKGISKLAR